MDRWVKSGFLALSWTDRWLGMMQILSSLWSSHFEQCMWISERIQSLFLVFQIPKNEKTKSFKCCNKIEMRSQKERFDLLFYTCTEA